jgi:hypothetical protein
MGCEIVDGPDGRTFICWSGKPPKEKKEKCSVCKRRWSTLLCDGVVEGERAQHLVNGISCETMSRKTCDAPLCEKCTTRPDSVFALPPNDGWPSDLDMAKVEWRKRKMRRGPTKLTEQRAAPLRPMATGVTSDTRDFCPACVARTSGLRQLSLGL